MFLQKQPSRGVLRKRRFENMQQIYRRAPIPRCDFNKAAKQLCWNHTSTLACSYKFAAYLQNTFSWEHLWKAASVLVKDRGIVNSILYQLFFYYCFISFDYSTRTLITFAVILKSLQNGNIHNLTLSFQSRNIWW